MLLLNKIGTRQTFTLRHRQLGYHASSSCSLVYFLPLCPKAALSYGNMQINTQAHQRSPRPSSDCESQQTCKSSIHFKEMIQFNWFGTIHSIEFYYKVIKTLWNLSFIYWLEKKTKHHHNWMTCSSFFFNSSFCLKDGSCLWIQDGEKHIKDTGSHYVANT